MALSDADVLLQSYQIKPSQMSLAMAFVTAHLLTVDDTDTDTTEPQVKRAKADTVEVDAQNYDVGNPTSKNTASYCLL